MRAWFSVSLCYLVVFAQRVAPLSITEQLSTDLHASALEIGSIFAAYFYAYTIIQLPAGIVNDIWPVRRTIMLSTAISACATLAFSLAHTWWIAAIARMFVAAGDVFVFTALMKLTADTFPANRFAFMAGLGQLAGFLGGALATVPFTTAVLWWGWRASFAGVAAIALICLVACALTVPAGRTGSRAPVQVGVQSLLALARSPIQWVAVAAASAGYIVFVTLSGTWGLMIFVQGYGYSPQSASLLVGVFIVCSAAGTFVSGYAIDRYPRGLRGPFVAAAIARMAFLLLLVPDIGGALGYWTTLCLMAGLGLIGGAQNPAVVAVLRSTQGPARLGVAIALMSTTQNLVGACLQPVFGAILDASLVDHGPTDTQIHSSDAFGLLLALLCLVSTAAGACVFLVPHRELKVSVAETDGEARQERTDSFVEAPHHGLCAGSVDRSPRPDKNER